MMFVLSPRRRKREPRFMASRTIISQNTTSWHKREKREEELSVEYISAASALSVPKLSRNIRLPYTRSGWRVQGDNRINYYAIHL